MSAKGLSMRRIKSELLECPQELDRLYEGLLGDIQDDELLEACTLFQWVCFAIRSLSLDELRIAMTVHLSGSKGSLREYEDGDNPQLIPSDAKMRKRMIHLSRGLVDMGSARLGDGKAIVGFHHDTIRDFMLKKGLSYLNGRLHEPRSLTQIASVQLANTCLQYLSTEEIGLACQEKEILSRERFQFLGYAATYWVSHAVIAERENLGEEITWPTETILDVWINTCKSLENSSSKTATEGTSLMHIAAEFGLEKLAKRILCTEEQKVPTISSHRKLRMSDTSKSAARDSTMKTARKSGQVKVNAIPAKTRTLSLNTKEGAGSWRKSDKGSKGARERVVGSDTVKVGRGGTREIVRMGLKGVGEKGGGALVNAQNKRGDSPLHLAAGHGSLEMVIFLCEWGSQTTQPNCYGWTPLFTASHSGHLEIVKFLYEHGADVHIAAKDGWTPLHTASCSGHLEVVKFLREHEADVHTATKDGWTPLCLASYSGNLEVVKFLYDHEADVHIATDDGRTPLHTASRSGHLEVVKFLCENGSRVETSDSIGRTSLFLASARSHTEVVQQLLSHGLWSI
ncbi:hypothetical protein N7455_000885 [Penicillium solitum]|uniref:uncharacterized protein n=1 Tax=Penicillium solitum TaxID=60172 RepID=UPI0032C48EA9|nr:hypothetical protein N7455_000885 [Penicillium solitum]